MASITQRPTAKIYQFPSRIGGGALRRIAAEQVAAYSKYADCASGAAWYHEEAIAEREAAPKR